MSGRRGSRSSMQCFCRPLLRAVGELAGQTIQLDTTLKPCIYIYIEIYYVYIYRYRYIDIDKNIYIYITFGLIVFKALGCRVNNNPSNLIVKVELNRVSGRFVILWEWHCPFMLLLGSLGLVLDLLGLYGSFHFGAHYWWYWMMGRDVLTCLALNKVPIMFPENTPIYCKISGGQWMWQHSCKDCLPISGCLNHGHNPRCGAPSSNRLVSNPQSLVWCTYNSPSNYLQ